MPHSLPTLPTLLLMAQCLALVVVLAALLAVWARLRSWPLAENSRLLREVAQRQRDIETRLARLEEDRTVPAVPTGPTRSAPSRQRFDPPAPSAVTGPTLIAVPNLSTALAGVSASAAAELGRRFGAIWTLADSGATAETIAQRTGQPIGQVELILGLRRRLSTHVPATTTPEGRA